MYKLCFYVPATHLDVVKEAVFAVGAGVIGNYDQCCWQTLGQGQFRPLPGSDPFLGNPEKLATVKEWKVEMVCEDHLIGAAVQAMKAAHPYEEPAFDAWPLADL